MPICHYCCIFDKTKFYFVGRADDRYYEHIPVVVNNIEYLLFFTHKSSGFNLVCRNDFLEKNLFSYEFNIERPYKENLDLLCVEHNQLVLTAIQIKDFFYLASQKNTSVVYDYLLEIGFKEREFL